MVPLRLESKMAHIQIIWFGFVSLQFLSFFLCEWENDFIHRYSLYMLHVNQFYLSTNWGGGDEMLYVQIPKYELSPSFLLISGYRLCDF